MVVGHRSAQRAHPWHLRDPRGSWQYPTRGHLERGQILLPRSCLGFEPGLLGVLGPMRLVPALGVLHVHTELLERRIGLGAK